MKHCPPQEPERKAYFDEIKLVKEIIGHPAKFDLDIFGILGIRSTDQCTIEVEWQEDPSGKKHVKSFDETELEAAASFFVEKRYELQYGEDFEIVELARKGF